MSAPVPSRAQIETAGEIEWNSRPARKEPTITIAAVYQGYAISVAYTGSLDQLSGAIERLKAIGAEPTDSVRPGVQSPARKPSARVTPAYDGDGHPMCPVHRKALSEGRYGLYCPSKATGDQAANDKGYCSLKFE